MQAAKATFQRNGGGGCVIKTRGVNSQGMASLGHTLQREQGDPRYSPRVLPCGEKHAEEMGLPPHMG